jgi:hypothetical protein
MKTGTNNLVSWITTVSALCQSMSALPEPCALLLAFGYLGTRRLPSSVSVSEINREKGSAYFHVYA